MIVIRRLCEGSKGKYKNITEHKCPSHSPLCVWMPTVTLHSRDLQQRPNDPSKSTVVSPSFSPLSHDLHLMTPVFYSHHLLCFYFLPDLCLSSFRFLHTILHPSQFDFLLHHVIFLFLLSLFEFCVTKTIWKSCEICKGIYPHGLSTLREKKQLRPPHTEVQSTVQFRHQTKIHPRV